MAEKSMTRALRRHHAARLKAARRFYHGRDNTETPRYLGQVVQTPASCSCWMCGNPRKYNGERTIQELREMQEMENN